MNSFRIAYLPERCNVHNPFQCRPFHERFFLVVTQIAGLNVTFVPLEFNVIASRELLPLLNASEIDASMLYWHMGTSKPFGDDINAHFSNPLKLEDYWFIYKKRLVLDAKYWFFMPFSKTVWLTILISLILISFMYILTNYEEQFSAKNITNLILSTCRALVNQTTETKKLSPSKRILLICWHTAAFMITISFASNILKFVVNNMGFEGPNSMAEAVESIRKKQYKFIAPGIYKNDENRQKLIAYTVRKMPYEWQDAWRQIILDTDLTMVEDWTANNAMKNVELGMAHHIMNENGLIIANQFTWTYFFSRFPMLKISFAYTAIEPKGYLFSTATQTSKKHLIRFNEAMALAYFYGLDQKLDERLTRETTIVVKHKPISYRLTWSHVTGAMAFYTVGLCIAILSMGAEVIMRYRCCAGRYILA